MRPDSHEREKTYGSTLSICYQQALPIRLLHQGQGEEAGGVSLLAKRTIPSSLFASALRPGYALNYLLAHVLATSGAVPGTSREYSLVPCTKDLWGQIQILPSISGTGVAFFRFSRTIFLRRCVFSHHLPHDLHPSLQSSPMVPQNPFSQSINRPTDRPIPISLR